MEKPTAKKAQRKPRADAQRNRERIVEVAEQVFRRRGAAASMDEIAKQAEIGPGTLYRHFPTRDALLEAVYLGGVERLAEAARDLAAKHAPVEALRAWMLVFIDYVAAKQIIAPALSAMEGGPTRVYEQSHRIMTEAARALGSRAVASGDLRADVDPMDLLRALYGVCSTGSGEDWAGRARQFVEILLQGARP